MKAVTFAAMGAILLSLLHSAACGAAGDPRFAPITGQQLIADLEKSGADPDSTLTIIARARNNGLGDQVVDYYQSAIRSGDKTALTSLYLGCAAYSDYIYLCALAPHKITVGSPKAAGLSKTASVYLAKAYKLDPSVGLIDAEYGHLAWVTRENMKMGLSLMRRGVSLAPKSAACHMLLADALSSPSSGRDRDLNAASSELDYAIQIDPASSDARQMLSAVCFWLGDTVRARSERETAARLMEPREPR